MDVSTPLGPELHIDASGHQEPVLLLEVNFAFLKSLDAPKKGHNKVLNEDINNTFGIKKFFYNCFFDFLF